MSDVFIEHMVRRKTSAKTVVLKILMWVAAIAVSAAALYFALALAPSLMMVAVLIPAGTLWMVWMVGRRSNVEFEYIITNHEMDIDKIMSRSVRRRLMTVDFRSFDILAPHKPAYAREYESKAIAKTVDVSSSPDAPGRWFAVFNGKGGERTLLIFEPSERMLEAFKTYISRKIKYD